MSNRGKAFIVSGPSGSGKTTLIDLLHQEFPMMIKNVSYTTRPKRDEETDGVDYFFVSDQEFDKRLEEGEFLDHVNLFDYRYGVSNTWIKEKLESGFSVFLVIDIQGAKNLKTMFEIPSIFIRPPSLKILEDRMRKRGTGEAQIATRLDRAKLELAEGSFYDYQVINDDLKTAYNELKRIVTNELK